MKGLAITIICFLLCCRISYAQHNDSVFVPMPVTIFEDNFQSDSLGAFPSHWRISHRDSVRRKRLWKVRNIKGRKALVNFSWTYGTTSGINPSEYSVFGQPGPKMPVANYLPDSFTLEYDFLIARYSGMVLGFYATNAAPVFDIIVEGSHMSYVEYSGEYGTTGERTLSPFKKNDWHHLALLYREHQAIGYIDGKK